MSNLKFAEPKDFFAQARKLGADEGKGAASRAEFLVDVAIAASQGTITDNKGGNGVESDAEKAWKAFREGAAKKAGTVVTAEASHKQRVSNVMQVIKAAVITGVNLADTFLDSRDVIVDARNKELTKANTFDAFVDIARAQIKKGSVDLTTDEVLTAICPAEKSAKDRNEVIVLEKLIADMKKIAKGTEPTENSPGKEGYPSDALTTATQLLEDRVTLLKLATMQGAAQGAQSRLIAATKR